MSAWVAAAVQRKIDHLRTGAALTVWPSPPTAPSAPGGALLTALANTGAAFWDSLATEAETVAAAYATQVRIPVDVPVRLDRYTADDGYPTLIFRAPDGNTLRLQFDRTNGSIRVRTHLNGALWPSHSHAYPITLNGSTLEANSTTVTVFMETLLKAWLEHLHI